MENRINLRKTSYLHFPFIIFHFAFVIYETEGNSLVTKLAPLLGELKSKKRGKVVACESGYFFSIAAMNGRQTACNFHNPSRLISTAAKRFGRMIRTIGFDEQTGERNSGRDFP